MTPERQAVAGHMGGRGRGGTPAEAGPGHQVHAPPEARDVLQAVLQKAPHCPDVQLWNGGGHFNGSLLREKKNVVR